jgi:hypothetical protein
MAAEKARCVHAAVMLLPAARIPADLRILSIKDRIEYVWSWLQADKKMHDARTVGGVAATSQALILSAQSSGHC